MKWEQTRQYSQKEIQAMQQDAIERVRQMQQRSEQVLRRSAKIPSFFIEDSSQHHLQNHQESYKEERKSLSPSTPHVVQESHPSSSFHPTPPNETKPSIEQLYKKVIDFLDKIVELLGTEKIAIAEFNRIVDSGFAVSSLYRWR